MPAKPPPKDAGKAAGKAAGKGAGKAAGKGGSKPCPICGKPASRELLPFCSPRCRDVDLNRWLSGSYVVPGSGSDDEDAE